MMVVGEKGGCCKHFISFDTSEVPSVPLCPLVQMKYQLVNYSMLAKVRQKYSQTSLAGSESHN